MNMIKKSTLLTWLIINNIGTKCVHGEDASASPSVQTDSPTTTPTLPFVSRNPLECIAEGEYNENIDYFPDKVVPEFSTQWEVTYSNNYKIITDKTTNTGNVFYMCGTPVPEVAGYPDPISIPLTGIALSSTPMIAFMEILDLRAFISIYVGGSSYISSTCVLSLIASEDIADVAGWGDVGSNSTLYLSGGSYDANYNLTTNSIYFSEQYESTVRGTFEWVKYMSALFNVEAEANERFNEVENRYTCISETLVASTTFVKPTVVWAAYSTYCPGGSGWNVGSCPNYYCDFASDCQADFLEFAESPQVGYCYTTEQLVRLANNADHFIYPSSNWESVYADNKAALDTMKSVANNEVFDYQGSGQNAWFEQRFVEYENVLEDFCEVVGTIPEQDRVWFRNVFTEPVGTLPTCPDPTVPHEPIVTTCILPTSPPTVEGDEAVAATGGGGCFSANNDVEVHGKSGFVSIDTVEVGDYIKTSSSSSSTKEEYSRVISLAHVDNDHETDFVRIHAEGIDKPLEITSLHLMYVSGKATRAGTVKVGDYIDTATTASRVTKVDSVKRVGVYAPITENGDIIISGSYRTSSYVAFLDALPYHLQHVLTHQFLSPRRLLCSYYDFNICAEEEYNESGYSKSIYWAVEVMEKTNQKFGATVQYLLASVAMPILFTVYSFEQMIAYPFTTMGIIVFYLYKRTNTKTA